MQPDQLLPSESRMDLPPPVAPAEKGANQVQPIIEQQGTERNPELLPAVTPGSQQATEDPQHAQAQAQVPSPQVPPQTQHAAQAAPAITNPAIADDIDLIEKEWVEKAKHIVSKTKEDPYKQNKEINKMKADYIKKRYNKDIQVGE